MALYSLQVLSIKLTLRQRTVTWLQFVFFPTAVIRNDTVRDIVYNDLETVMPQVIFTPSDPEVAKKLKEFYMPKLPELSDLPSFLQMTDMFTDRSFFNGLHDAAKRQSGNSTVYIYYYNYQGEFQLNSILIAMKRKYPVVLELAAFVIRNLYDKYILRKEPPAYGIIRLLCESIYYFVCTAETKVF